eukprot:595257-Hanusia_phi.AAC.1
MSQITRADVVELERRLNHHVHRADQILQQQIKESNNQQRRQQLNDQYWISMQQAIACQMRIASLTQNRPVHHNPESKRKRVTEG